MKTLGYSVYFVFPCAWLKLFVGLIQKWNRLVFQPLTLCGLIVKVFYKFCDSKSRYPLKAVKVMHTVALRTESSLPISTIPPIQLRTFKVCIDFFLV